jgi:hypothetical protein
LLSVEALGLKDCCQRNASVARDGCTLAEKTALYCTYCALLILILNK